MIIGLTGTIAAGKSTIAAILKEKGYEHFTYSDILRKEAKKLGIVETRENLQKLGTKIKNDQGKGVLSRLLIESAKTQNVIADGIRTVDEIKELKKYPDSAVIGVDAPVEIRYNRLKSRARSGDELTFERFRQIDEIENSGVTAGQEITSCLKHADYIIINDKDAKELKNKLNKILSHLN